MGWRVTWTPKGSPFPEWHDFHYEEPAQVLAQVRRIQGATNVRVIPIPGPQTAPGATNTPSRVSADAPTQTSQPKEPK